MPHCHIHYSANLKKVVNIVARVEIYCSDYQTVDLEPIKWDLQDPQRQTLWGAQAPESWFKHGTTFVGVDTKDSDIQASPIIAP